MTPSPSLSFISFAVSLSSSVGDRVESAEPSVEGAVEVGVEVAVGVAVDVGVGVTVDVGVEVVIGVVVEVGVGVLKTAFFFSLTSQSYGASALSE